MENRINEVIQKKVKKLTGRNKAQVTIGIIASGLIVTIIFLLVMREMGVIERLFSLDATITLSSPEPMYADNRDEIVINALVSNLPKREYPAVSLSVHFDTNRLEFLGVRQGNMVIKGEGVYHIPIWSVDVEVSNRRGIVNTMYLDITGGDFPYIVTDADTLIRLVFRLRDSIESGDVLYVTIEDAVFATVDVTESVAMSEGNLNVHHAQIVVR
jgi:hypothetical protein